MIDFSPPPEVQALIDATPPDWGVDPDGTGYCIFASKLAVTVLQGRLGVPCKALACNLYVFNALAHPLFDQGVPMGLWPDAAWSVGVSSQSRGEIVSEQEPGRRHGFAGHVVVVGDGWFLDMTPHQLARPAKGIIVPGAMVGPYDPAIPGVRCALPEDGLAEWRWRPELKGWRTAPGWRKTIERSYLDAVVEAVQRRLGSIKQT